MKRALVCAVAMILSLAMITGCGKDNTVETPAATTQSDGTVSTDDVDKTDASGNEVLSREEPAKELTADEMKEVYLEFIRGNENATVKNEDISWYETGKEYSYDELKAAFEKEMKDLWEEVSLTDAQFAFIDCGDDGIPEFAVKQIYRFNIDGAELYNIFKYIDGKLYCVYSNYSYYRSYLDLNEYGYIVYGGSGGAATYYCEHSFVDKDGNEKFLFSETDEMGMDGPYIPTYLFPNGEAPEGYPEDIYSYTDDYKLSYIYNFEKYRYNEDDYDDSEYRSSYFFAFTDYEGNNLEPDSDIAKIYKDNNIKYYSYEEAEKKVKDHVASLGVTDKIKQGEDCQWSSFLAEGIGEYKKEITGFYDIMGVTPGKWKMPEDSLVDGISGVFLNVQETGEFEVNVNYSDSYTSPAYITGHFAIMYDSDKYEEVVGFYTNTSNSSSVKEKNYMGIYSIDEYVLNSNTITMTLGGDASYFFEQCTKNDKPVFVKEYSDEIYDKVKRVYNTSEEYFCNDDENSDRIVEPLEITFLSCDENQITDEYKWFNMLGIQQTGETYSDDMYTYRFGGTEGYGTYTALYIYDKETNELVRAFDFHAFVRAAGYEASDFVDRSIRYALIKDNVLYVNLYHRTYASSCPSNAYVMAIDMNYGSVIWKSQPLVSNSNNFLILGDSIITGYGFTAEDHYLTEINRYNGSVLGKINVKKSPEYFYYRDGLLYVRTYSFDYVFEVWN